MPPPFSLSSIAVLAIVLASPFAMVVPMSAQATPLRTEIGLEADAQFGQAVSFVGDVDADGYDDFAVGTPTADFVVDDAGRVTVYSGASPSTVLFVWDGGSAVDQFGWSVAGAGDTNGDGHDDVIVGAIGDDSVAPNSGAATVFSGADGSVLFSSFGNGAFEVFGWVVDSAGDFDRDGFDDVLVGAPGDDENGAESGSVTVFSVRTGQQLARWVGADPLAQFGRSAAGIGDVDGDGFDDIAAGAPFANVVTLDEGVVQIFSGASGAVLHTEFGTTHQGYLGWSLDGVGDIDGDGLADWIAGEPFHHDGVGPVGRARIFSGASSTVIQSWTGPSNFARLGWSVAGCGGDLDADGVVDAVIGAPGANESGIGGALEVGRVSAMSGASGLEIFSIVGAVAGDNVGDSVAAGGDTNANGYHEVLTGSPFADVLGVGPNVGVVELLEIATPLPDRARFRTFGAGCVGSHNGLPRLDARGRPALGQIPFVTIDSAPPWVSGLLCLDFQTFPIDLTILGFSGCVLRTPNVIGAPVQVDGAGSLQFPLPIPNNTLLVGSSIYLQSVLIDIDSSGVPGAILSNAALLVPGL